MSEKFKKIIDEVLASEEKGESKVVGLADAVARYIEPGMKLHIGEGCEGTVREIIRQFWGNKTDFTVITTGVRHYAQDLVHCGMVRKLIMSAFPEAYPRQGVSRIMQRAFKDGTVEIENWSLYSMIQRFMAGAMDIGFMPTKSIIGSTMEQENAEDILEIPDPFGSGNTIGAVKALNPDVSIIHGLAADRYGNTILAPEAWCGGQSLWGALASKSGVLVTVEELISTESLRENQALVKLPGYLVDSVSVMPFGSHPHGLACPNGSGFISYGADYQFLNEHRAASQKPETLDEWLKAWITDCPERDDYLGKLGAERLLFLQDKAHKDSWKYTLGEQLDKISAETGFTETEMMISAAARKIAGDIKKNQYRLILSPIGTAALAAWVAYYDLRREGYDIDLTVGTGVFGFTPPFADPYAYNIANLATCKMFADSIQTYGVFVAGNRSKCISVMGAGQTDKYGNVNTSRAPDGGYLIGSGGANDAANAPEVVIMCKQSRGRLVEKVSYITSVGKNVRVLISDKGIYEKTGDSDELILTGFFQNAEKTTPDEIIAGIKQSCGWDLKVSPTVSEITPPTENELLLLRMMDPAGYFRTD